MLLTQLLSASTLAVPVWAQSHTSSHSDPQQNPADLSRNLQFTNDRIQEYQQPVNQNIVEDQENQIVYPYQLQQQKLLRHRQLLAYSANKKTYIIHNQDGVGKLPQRSEEAFRAPSLAGPQTKPIASHYNTVSPVLEVSGDAKRTISKSSAIKKKIWPTQSVLQTKSLTRKVSFNRNVVFTDEETVKTDLASTLGVGIRRLLKNVTNIRTESAWENGGGVWSPHQRAGWDRSENEKVSMTNSDEVYSEVDRSVLSGNDGADGMNRRTNDGVDRPRNSLRVNSVWKPYGIRENGLVVGENSVSNEYNHPKNRVVALGNNKTGINQNSGRTGSPQSREELGRNTAAATVAGIGGSGGVSVESGEILTDFWGNYGYKLALVTAAGLIGFLAFLGVVRCLRSSSTESGVITSPATRGAVSNNSGSGRGIRSAGLALTTSLLPEEDRTPLNPGSPYFVPMLSVQSPGYAGMERLGVPARSTSSSSQSTTAPVMVGLHHHHTLADDDDYEDCSSVSRSASASRRSRMAPSRDYFTSSGDNQGKCNKTVEGSGGVDVKVYVALERSSVASLSSSSELQQQQWLHYNNASTNNNKGLDGGYPVGPLMGSDMNNGRCPHHVKLGDSEWGKADRPVNPIRVPYQTELTRTYIKPPPNKTALDVPDRDNTSRVGAAAAMPSRNSSSNLVNFPYVHGMSVSQEALSSSSGGGGVASSGVSKSSKQSNFPFSRFFKSRGSNTSINNSSSNANGHSAKSRPESPCRYASASTVTPICGASRSNSAVDMKQQQIYSDMPLSESSISLASTMYANSGLEGHQQPLLQTQDANSSMVMDVTTSSTNYCVFVTATTEDGTASSYRLATTSTTTSTTKHRSPCDTNREIDLGRSSTAVAGTAGATVSSNRHNINNNSNIKYSSHHSRGNYTTNAGHSINSYQTAGPQIVVAPLPAQHQKVSTTPGPRPIMKCAGDNDSGCSIGGGVGGAVAVKSAATTAMASCDKRVYVEKRIKTSESESTDSTICSGGTSAGFKRELDTDQSV